MTREELVGATLAVGFPGGEATEELITHLRRVHARSVVVFSHNYQSPEQFLSLIRRLEEALGWRLLVLVDHEGGRVVRFGQGVTRFADALTAGRAGDAQAIERQGMIEAQELGRLSVQVNLAPCVDVLVAGSDPVIGDRSYGSDPDRVSALSVARILGLQRHGVAACAKHFPGLGAVQLDPHKLLPTITLDRQAIESVHLAPFRAAIEAEVATVMSSHVCYPLLGDPEGVPATFSPQLIRKLLRGVLGFRGVILTDDLTMGALDRFGPLGVLAGRAADSGHDLLLICQDLPAQFNAFSELCNSYKQNKLASIELEKSVERIEGLRRRFFG